VTAPNADLVDIYLRQLSETIDNMSRKAIWSVIEVLMDAWRNGRHVFIFGNGGSASTASHMVNDLNKLTIAPGKRRFKVCAWRTTFP